MAAPTEKYILYIDDTGSRDPDNDTNGNRLDKMDCFGLGGILVKGEDTRAIWDAHTKFCQEWKIDYPLHSSKIRGGQGKFGWLKKPENAGLFWPALEDFILAQPIIAIACIIDRPGYVMRYQDMHKERLWLMCKTAFCILVERAAKYADEQGRKLEIFFEESGKHEDRNLQTYMKELKEKGNPFNPITSGEYAPYTAEDYRRIVIGSPIRKSKNVPMLQLADLVLYPIAKGGYEPEYRPYKNIKKAGKLIDSFLPEAEKEFRGIKYSCFNC